MSTSASVSVSIHIDISMYIYIYVYTRTLLSVMVLYRILSIYHSLHYIPRAQLASWPSTAWSSLLRCACRTGEEASRGSLPGDPVDNDLYERRL